jgi:hypothetical protein
LFGGVVCDAANKRTRDIADNIKQMLIRGKKTRKRIRRRRRRRRRKKKKEEGKNRVPNMSLQGEKSSSNGCGSCYSRTATEMCCRLKERDGMLLRAKKE